MKQTISLLSAVAAVLLTGCGKQKAFVSDNFAVSPTPLEYVAGEVPGTLSINVPAKVMPKKATVACVAEGGILEVDVKYNGTTLFSHTDGQMHTNKGSYGTAEVDMTDPATDCSKFSITVKDGESSAIVSSATVTGQAPQALIIPGQWAWPTERTNIETSYNETSTTEGDQSFKNFAEHAGESQKWFNHPTNKVMNESSLGYNQ